MKEIRARIALACKLRQSHMDAEKALWAKLRNKQLEGVKFRRQQPLDAYIVDFVNRERDFIQELWGRL